MSNNYVHFMQFTYLAHDSKITLKGAYKFVVPAYAVEWKDIGINLGIQCAELNIIERDNNYQTKACCREMLNKWLQIDLDASWAKLHKTLKKTTTPSKSLHPDIKSYFKESYQDLFIQKIKL